MVMQHSYSGAQSDTLERTFPQPVKPVSPVAVGEHPAKGQHEEGGLCCFCTPGCGFGFHSQMEPEHPNTPGMYLGLDASHKTSI